MSARLPLTPLRAGALVAALAAAVYLNTLPNAFVIDDRGVILDNVFLRQPGGLRKIFTTDVWGFFGPEAASSYYRPLMHTTLFFLWRVSHQNPAGYHAFNILLHATVSVLVFLCLRRLYSAFRIAEPGSACPLVAALLFAVHPIHTEAAGWISALPDLQCALFFLLGFWLYLCAEAETGARRYLLETGVAACVLAGLLAKEIGLLLPLMLALYAVSRRGRRPAPYLFAATAAAIGLYLVMRWNALGSLVPQVAASLPLKQTVAGWFLLLWEYSARIVWPATLSSFHVVPVPGGFLEWKVLAGLVIVAGLAVLAAWLYGRERPEWLAVPLFLLALAPSFLAPVRENGFWMGERYLYLPSVAFCWLIAVVLLNAVAAATGTRNAEARNPPPVPPQPRGPEAQPDSAIRNPQSAIGRAVLHSAFRIPHSALRWVCVVTLLLTYTVRTVARNQDWRDEVGFYLHELHTEGESPQIRPLLVEAYVRRGMLHQALEHAQAMVLLAPRDPRAHNSLGFVYWISGESGQALASYQRADGLARQRGETGFAARALNNIAVAHSQMGRLDLAVPEYREVVRLDPGFVEGHVNLGYGLAAAGDPEGARQAFARALALDPSHERARAGNAALRAPEPQP